MADGLPALQAGGHRFDPGHVHQSFQSFVEISAERLFSQQAFLLLVVSPASQAGVLVAGLHQEPKLCFKIV